MKRLIVITALALAAGIACDPVEPPEPKVRVVVASRDFVEGERIDYHDMWTQREVSEQFAESHLLLREDDILVFADSPLRVSVPKGAYLSRRHF